MVYIDKQEVVTECGQIIQNYHTARERFDKERKVSTEPSSHSPFSCIQSQDVQLSSIQWYHMQVSYSLSIDELPTKGASAD